MKAVLMSINPKWCEPIASDKKTVEVRKTKPKLETPFKVYIYCTRGNGELIQRKGNKFLGYTENSVCGKVIGEFVCDRIYNITPHFDKPDFCNQYLCDWKWGEGTACLSFTEMNDYLKGKNGYGWHISDLVIYDKPKELSEFFYACDKPKGTDCSVCLDHRENKCKAITRPPQSWCYVEEGRDNGKV